MCVCGGGGVLPVVKKVSLDSVILGSGDDRERGAGISKKYDGGRVPDFVVLEMDPSLRDTAMDLLSKARAKKTWQQFNSAMTSVKKLEKEFDLDFSMPWSSAQLMNYLTACRVRDLRWSTVNSYLSQIRSVHKLAGLSFSCENLVTKYLLRAMKNTDKEVRVRRLAVTPRILLTLKHRLKQSGIEIFVKLSSMF